MDVYDPRYYALNRMRKSGKNSSTMLQDNRNLILQLIREAGSISRKELVERSGLRLATVTIIMKELMERGLIRENGMVDGGNGRRVSSFAIEEGFYVISVRMTSAYIKLALFDIHIRSENIQKIFFQTEDHIEETLSLVQSYVGRIEETVDKSMILGIALGVEHRYKLLRDDYHVWDEKKGEYCPIGKLLHDLTGYRVFTNRTINFSSYDLWDRYREKYQIKDEYITILNIQVSYDLESAIIVNGEILYGAEDLCGQFENYRIDRNSDRTYRDVATVPALLNRATELLEEYPDSCVAEIDDLNIRDIIAGYEKKDLLCRRIYDELVYYLGYLIAGFINWLDPTVLYFGDEVPHTENFMDSLRAETAKYCGEEKASRIFAVTGGRTTKNDPGLIGAAKYSFDLMVGNASMYPELLGDMDRKPNGQ